MLQKHWFHIPCGSHAYQKNRSNASFKTIISRICEKDKLLTKTSGSVTNSFDTVELFPKYGNLIWIFFRKESCD